MFAEAIIWSEYLSQSRRWQTYFYRAGYLGVAVAGLAILWPKGQFDYSRLALFGNGLVATLLVLQFACCVLFTAPYVANSLLEEREQNTLGLLVISRLSSWEIALGKLMSRVFYVVSYLFYGLPFVIMAISMGGVSVTRLLAGFTTVLAVTLLAGAAGTVAGLECRGSFQAGLFTYGFLLVFALLPAGHLCGWNETRGFMISPGEALWVLAAKGTSMTQPLWHYWLIPDLYCLGMSGLLIVYSVPRLERVARRSLEDQRGAVGVRPVPRMVVPLVRWLSGDPAAGANPVQWREVRTVAFSAGWRHVAWVATVLLAAAAIVVLGVLADSPALRGRLWRYGLGIESDELLAVVVVINYAVAGMTVVGAAVLAALGFIRERRTRSIETLVLTPLSAREIISGKAVGLYRSVLPLGLWPAVLGLVAVPFAWLNGEAAGAVFHWAAACTIAFGLSRFAVYSALDTSLVESRPAKALVWSVLKVMITALIAASVAGWIAFPIAAILRSATWLDSNAATALGVLILCVLVALFARTQSRRLERRMVDYFEYYLGISETTLSGYRPPRDLGEAIGAPEARRRKR